MKKLFALLLLCAFGSMVMMAQSDVTPSYRFEETDNGKTLTIYGKGDLTQFATNLSAEPNAQANLKDALSAKIIEKGSVSNGLTGSFETVKFVNEGEAQTLAIDNDIVHAILYPVNSGYPVCNKSIATLDLGAAKVVELSSNTFSLSDYSWYMPSVSEITLPLTDSTLVKTETIGGIKEAKRIVVPSNILDNFKNHNMLKLTTVNIPEGYQWIGDNAFYGNGSLTKVTLPSTLTVIGSSAFYSCSQLKDITLNEGLQNIGKKAFQGTALTEINFPKSLRIVNDGAFWNCRIVNLKFNAGLYFIGNSAFGLNNNTGMETLKTLEIPASVRYIGPGAFMWRLYQDVYFYGKEAPLMPMGKINEAPDFGIYNTAFSASIQMGNNGFSPSEGNLTVEDMGDKVSEGYANRENYKNGGVYFCILHYPKELDEDARAKYTDVTRVYKTYRGDDGSFYGSGSYAVGEESETWKVPGGETTAQKDVNWGYEDTYLGGQYVWPSQNQWMRSYIVNSNGYNWDGVTSYPATDDEDYWLENDIETLAYAGYVIGSEEGQYTEEDLRKIAHMGTRLFVLADADVNGKERSEGDEDEPYPLSMTGGNWWTICVPFDMTKKQVDEVFGSGTHVCRFSSVTRNEEGENNNLVLKFQNDVYTTKWVRDSETLLYNKQEGETPGDDDVVIYSHEAYMIYPTRSDADATEIINVEDYDFVPGSPYPTIIKANAGVDGATDQTEYRFVGTYLTEVNSYDADSKTSSTVSVKIPQYSYMYAKKKGDEAYKFWFLTGENMSWSANKCIVQVSDRDARAGEYLDFFGGDGNNSKVDQSSLFGEDNSATAIENVTVIAGEGKDAQVVYSINGQVVRGNGSLDGLGKGVYIRGGKKFVVK